MSDELDRNILNIMNDKNIIVKHLLREDVSTACKAANHFYTPIDTHYLMVGDKILHVGNEKTIHRFILNNPMGD